MEVKIRLSQVWEFLRSAQEIVEKETIEFIRWRTMYAYENHKRSVRFVLNSWESIELLYPLFVEMGIKTKVQKLYANRLASFKW